MGRMWAAAFSVLLGVTVLGGNGKEAAAADDKPVYMEFKNAGIKMCLDGTFYLYPRACNGGDHQKWAVSGSGPLKVIRQKAGGQCLSSKGDVASPKDCKPGDESQHWKLEGGDTKFLIADSGKCLKMSKQLIQLTFSNCSSNGKQEDSWRWTVLGEADATKPPVDNRTFMEFKNAGARMCLDGAKDRPYPHACNNGDHQKWVVEGSGPLKAIRQKATGSCLSQYLSPITNSTDPVLTECDTRQKAMKQKWKIEGNLRSRSIIADDGKCLETDGKKLWFSNCDEMHDQRYRRWEEKTLK
jgi:hypothetical protein